MAETLPESRQAPGGASNLTGARPNRPGYKPAPEEAALIARVTERLDLTQRDGARWALERQSFETIAFYHGIQWLEYSDSTRRLTRWQGPSWLPTPVTNRIAPAVAQMTAPLARMQPQGRVRPNSNETRDIEAARVAEQLTSHADSVTSEKLQRHRAALIAALSGTVIAEDFWNPRKGKWTSVPKLTLQELPMREQAATCPTCGPVADVGMAGAPCPQCGAPTGVGERDIVGDDGQPVMDIVVQPEVGPDGQPVIEMYQEGDLETRIRPLFNFYWDPKAATLEEARWCGEVMYVDLDWVDQNYPEMGPYVASEEGVDSLSFYEASLLSLVGPSVQGAAHYGGTMQMFQNGVVLRKYQEKPSVAHPNGLFIIVANGVLLYKGDLPLKDETGRVTGDFTYTEFRYDEVPGRFPGRTPTDDMIPQQKRINGIDCQLILNRKTMGNPWILAPKGSGINPAGAQMQPGTVIPYNHVGIGVAPQIVQPTPMPEQVLSERAQAMEAIMFLARDGAMGPEQVPANVKSGIALNVAREFLQEMSQPRLERWALWFAARAKKRLLLMQQHYREERAVKVTGQGAEYQVRKFKGADIHGNTDLVVEAGSLLPKSPSQQAQLVFDMIESGLLQPTNPVERTKAVEILGLAGFDTETGPDERRARKENAMMEEGQLVPVTEVENSQIHLMIHLAREKEPSYDSLPEAAKMALRQHRMETQQKIQAEMQQAQIQQEEEVARQISMAERLKMAGQGGLANFSLPQDNAPGSGDGGGGGERQAA